MKDINIENYEKKSRRAFYSSMGLALIQNHFIEDNTILNNLVGVGASLLSLTCIYYLYKERKAKKIIKKEIDKLYDEIDKLYYQVIENINDLNKLFDLKNPVEIYSMYEFMLHNGYLSKDHIFTFDNSVLEVFGPTCLSGGACCRHTASMLADIFKSYGYTAARLNGVLEEEKYSLVPTNEDKYTIEELAKLVQEKVRDIEKQEELLGILLMEALQRGLQSRSGLDLCISKEKENRLRAKIIGNHAITSVGYENNSYFFDPTNKHIFLKDGDILISNDDNTIFKPRVNLKNMNYNMINKKIFNLPNIDKETLEYKEHTYQLCKENLDILEKFYQDNKEIYEEVGNTLTKVKKK